VAKEIDMVASRGPVPKRTEERRRTNAPEDGIEVSTAPAAEVVDVPEPDVDWHPIAHDWYLSLEESGQAKFYEPSDWMTAYVLAEQMSRLLVPRFVGMEQLGDGVARAKVMKTPMNGGELGGLLKGMSDLLTTESARRRMRIELQRGPAEDEGPSEGESAVVDARSRFGAKKAQ
jgi:hypothetical protein